MTPRRRKSDRTLLERLNTREVLYKAVSAFMFGLALALAVPFVFVMGPELETRAFPVVRNVTFELLEEDREVGYQRFKVTAISQRDCTLVELRVVAGDTDKDVLRTAHYSIKELTTVSPDGLHVYDFSVIGDIGNYVRVDTTHDCHALWHTVSAPWGEWRRR